MIKKINRVIKRYRYLYTNKNQPTFKELFFNKKDILAYYGFLGDRNFGDEWVYEATKLLFPNHSVLPIQKWMTLHAYIIKKIFPKRIKGIVIGGGTLIGESFWFEDDFNNLRSQQLPVFFHGTGVHLSEKLNKNWHKLFDDSTVFGGVRGPIALNNLNNHINLNARVIGDAAFSMFENKTYQRDTKKVILNLGTHSSYKNSYTTKDVTKQFVQFLIEQDFTPIFFPFHPIDLEIGKSLKIEFPQIIVLDIPKTYDEAKKVFIEAKFAFGERLHFAILAIMTGCSFMTVSYNQKHVDMLESLQLNSNGVFAKDLTLEIVINAFCENNMKLTKDAYKYISQYQNEQKSEARAFINKIEIG